MHKGSFVGNIAKDLEMEGMKISENGLRIIPNVGAIYALTSFDYETFKKIQFQVKAQDGGSPSLSSNVSVILFILDQNDNVPEILHPSPPADGSTGIELAPRSSEPGYLVTKVVAVDADSGQNAWLSYQLIRATEPGLFTVGLHTGEIRTARLFLEKDALKQILVVLVKDNGQPPLSASVTLTVVLADNIPEILSDLSNISAPVDPQSDLTFYLVIAPQLLQEEQQQQRPQDSRSEGEGGTPGKKNFPASLMASRGPIAAPRVPQDGVDAAVFPNNVVFVKGNYVLDQDELLEAQKPEYDVILCLSVTKWVQLNWGDEGLKRLFKRIYRHLRPGGVLVLEPQAWSSYKKRKNLTETISRHYHRIKLKPDQFPSYLTSSEVGFSSYELVAMPRNTSKGFQGLFFL
ncbi:7SK snRNA methylphosphate capping enzyme [Crotalus adamanteus]|uniref:RNA methyltransferase n=1 Tax=Crotalus adamanteus TaxID=8729 RepID=A0AAW1BQT8_CROAD